MQRQAGKVASFPKLCYTGLQILQYTWQDTKDKKQLITSEQQVSCIRVLTIRERISFCTKDKIKSDMHKKKTSRTFSSESIRDVFLFYKKYSSINTPFLLSSLKLNPVFFLIILLRTCIGRFSLAQSSVRVAVRYCCSM